MTTAIQQTSLPRRQTQIQFLPSHRWACCGKTGTGKTVFLKWWGAHWYHNGWPVVIIDIKRKFVTVFANTPEEATLLRPYCIDGTGELIPGCSAVIYHPSLPGWQDETLNRLLLAILAHGNIVLIVDEVGGVADESHCP